MRTSLNFDGKQLVGFQKTSMVDYPGKVAAVIFFPFCNMRCPWCHNGDLILNRTREGLIPLNEALSHIAKRKSVLGGVVLSGGEASLYPRITELIAYIKKLSLLVKLDMNGTLPDTLEKILSSPETRPDYIAMDLKIAPPRYAEIMADKNAATPAAIAAALEGSAALVRESGLPHEFRSLNLPSPYFTEADIAALRPLAGSSAWNFRPLILDTPLDPSWAALRHP
ncbi:MAG: anaerobic ribonucleoside-triphosphate reductase activating protein [Spirochaetaceae bacterium]|jgi:pyruvate formate lyase activating enzyme|nr:anaerobic ribonucleoside-triphosphate reductase activating protein [Spirochaetaceae bacterium]